MGAGLAVEHVVSYGFPLSNLLRPMSNAANWWKIRQRQRTHDEFGLAQATAGSGVDRRVENRLFRIYASKLFRVAFRVAFRLQRWFYESKAGTG